MQLILQMEGHLQILDLLAGNVGNGAQIRAVDEGMGDVYYFSFL